MHYEFLIERTAIHSDADGFSIINRDFANRRKLLIAALAGAHIAGIDAIFVELPGAFGIFGQKDVAVVMEVADDRRAAADIEHALLDFGDGGGSFRHIYSPANDFGARFG